MKVLIINKFLKPKGGSETYIIKIGDCLKQKGHQYFGMDEPGRTLGNRVNQYTASLDFHTTGFKRFLYPFKIIYSREAREKLMLVLEDFRPDAVHINNFNYQLTPSILYAIRDFDKRSGTHTAVLYTAHDYQLICPNHMLNSPADGQNCGQCVGGRFFSCIRKRCIHLSLAKSILGAAEGAVYRTLKVYRHIDRIICPSYFLEEKMNQVELFRNKTVTLHNFADGGRTGSEERLCPVFWEIFQGKGNRDPASGLQGAAGYPLCLCRGRTAGRQRGRDTQH